jgi:hypothetical protein
MRTPRDILFARHQNAVPKLDAIRQSTVTAVCDRRTSANDAHERRSQTAATTALQTLWRELIFPCRRIWAGLAAAWIVIFVFNFSQRDPSELMARKTPPPSPEMILSYRQQEKILAELIGQNEPRVGELPKTFSPRPSSKRQFETLTA